MLIAGCTVSAQSKFTEHVKSQQTGEGKVVIIQTPQIDDVVNNTPQPVKNNPATPSNEQRGHDSSKKPSDQTEKTSLPTATLETTTITLPKPPLFHPAHATGTRAKATVYKSTRETIHTMTR